LLTPYPTRRTGLGRGFADIVAASGDRPSPEVQDQLVGGPDVVPLEVVPFAMLLADGHGRVRSVNRRWVQASGLSPEAAAGRGWLAALAEGERVLVEQGLDRVRAGAPCYQGRHRWSHRAARATWYMTSRRQGGDLLIGIAVSEPVAAASTDPYLAELSALLRSADALLASLDRFILRLAAQSNPPG
jgi:PAS domain S-box-containing protein